VVGANTTARKGLTISVIEEEEEESEVAAHAVSEVPPTDQGCRSAFDDDSDDESIASSVSCYSMASTDDFDSEVLLASGVFDG
jgi:hypothetical protein